MKRVEIFIAETRYKLEQDVEELINRPGVRVIAMSFSESGRFYSVLVCYEVIKNESIS